MGFAPAPGRIELLRFPSGPGLRIDAGMSRGDVDPARVRLDDREGDRLGPGPRRGPRSSAPRAGRDDDRGRRRQHEPGLPARAAGPPRRAWRATWTPPGSTGFGSAPRRTGSPRRRRPTPGRGRARRAQTAVDRAPSMPSRGAGGLRPRRRPHARSSSPSRPALPGERQQVGPGSTGSPSTAPRRGERRAAQPARAAGSRRAAQASGLSLEPGRRPAHRGRRRPAPGLPRRGRPGAQPRPRGRRLDPGGAGRRGRGGRRRGGGREHEDGVVARRAGRGPGAARCWSAPTSRWAREPLVRIEPLEPAGPGPAGSGSGFGGRQVSADRAELLPREPAAAGVAHARLRREPGEVRADRRGSSRRLLGPLACDPALIPGEHRLLSCTRTSRA